MHRPIRRFAFRLCLAGVGSFPHPDMLLEVLTSKQLSEWMAFAQLEPFGERNRDLSIGLMTSLLANVNRDKKRKKEPFVPEDFMPSTYEMRLRIKKEQEQKENSSNFLLTAFRSLRDARRKNKRQKNGNNNR